MTAEGAPRPSLMIGVDVGGTKVAAGTVNRLGEIGDHVRLAMNPRGTAEEGFTAVAAAIDAILAKSGAARPGYAIGVCAPGPLDPARGVVVNPPNVPCWREFPLADEIEKRYGVRAPIDNDANAAALAEARWGAGRCYGTVFYAGIGTGIGTGIVFSGKVYHGRTGSAAEGGHVTIDLNGPICNCGKKGCIEVLASGTAIARRGREAAISEPSRAAALLELAGGDAQAIRSEMVGAAASRGDPLASEILAVTLEYLAAWLGNIVDLLEPDVILLGGGVSVLLTPYFEEIRSRMKRWCVNDRYSEIPLLPGHYGENAGVAGGAALCCSE